MSEFRVSYITKCIDPEDPEFEVIEFDNAREFDAFEEAHDFANTLMISPPAGNTVIGIPCIEVL